MCVFDNQNKTKMIKLYELENVMKGQFVWSKKGNKKLETDEQMEGGKDLARDVFVGLSDVYGFDASDVCDYLDMGYDSYRHKLMYFREAYREGKRRQDAGELFFHNDRVTRIFVKISLCMNAIRSYAKRDQQYKLDEYDSRA